ncbi:hypothetical protein [Streptomyces exfoliatus]|uniref:hypothetical protein n=1 Tax=Streptomyces exfoliatus TaxID=1905 RepID=UPI0037A9000A
MFNALNSLQRNVNGYSVWVGPSVDWHDRGCLGQEERALGAQVARANGADLGLDNQGRLHGDGDLLSGDGRLAHVDVLGDAVGVRQVSGTGLATFRCEGG